jgi:hypothetical protein
MFEANVTSDAEEKRHVREAANKLAAATYDVRERFGQFLFAARDLAEYNDRLALSKDDIIRTIEPHVFPRTGTVRRVLKPLEREFKSLRRVAAPEDDPLFGPVMGGPRADATTPGAGNYTNAPLSSGDFSIGPGGSTTPGVSQRGFTTDPSGIGSGGGGKAGGGGGAAGGGSSSSGSAAGGGSSSSSSGSGGSGGGGGSSMDPIGPGKYTIQPGDTYSELAQRAGYGDDYKGFAQSTGYQADNPDMIYAGDTIDVKAKGDAGSPASPASPASPESPATPAAAPSGPEPGGASPMSGTPSAPSAPAPLAAESANLQPTARRRRADFERNLDTDETFSPSHGELEPEGDFRGYLSDVDQGAESKVDRNFGGTFPGGTDHAEDPAKTDFAKSATLRFAKWCQANQVRPTLASLEEYGASDREYIFIAAGLQRLAKPSGPEWTAKGKPKQLNTKPDTGPTPPKTQPAAELPGQTTNTLQAKKRYVALCRQAGLRPTNKGFRKFLAGEHSLENRPRGNPLGAPGGRYSDPTIMDTDGQDPMAQALADDDGVRKYPELPKHRKPQHRAEARRRTAAPDYLQKADEALTNLLNQKAEEFQQTIAPLQQALQTVQQAEQEAAAANPMNVMPPAGTVNVLPGQDQQGAGAAGGDMDPNALAGLMGGGAAGGDPMAGGGDPMGGDPGQQDPQQMMARRRFARLHQAKNCKCWDGYKRVPGTKPCAKGSCEKCDTHKEARRRQAKEYDSEGLLTNEGLRDWSKKLQHEDDDDDSKKEARRRFARLHQAKNCECWEGYKRVPGTKPCAKGSCEKCDTHSKNARRRQVAGGQGKARGGASPRTAKNVEDLWNKFTQETTLRGGDPDIETFAQKYRVGPRALKRIRQKTMGG